MEPYDSMHGKVWNGKQKSAIFEIFKFSFYLRVTFRKQLDLILFELENGKLYSKTAKLDCFQTVRFKDLGFQLLQTMFAVWNRVRYFLL